MKAVAFTAGIALAALLSTMAVKALPQGMATGGRSAQPRRALPPGKKAPLARFEDVAEKAGLTAVTISGAPENKQYIIETTGTGVAIFDYDGDGLPDIFLVNGGRFQDEGSKPSSHLYRNLGGLRFEDVTARAGIPQTGWGQGVCAGDIDNDGKTDLLITQWGQNILLRNQGNGAFRDETAARGLASAERRWSTGCAFLDYDRDGHLDLLVAHYVAFDPNNVPKPGDTSNCRWNGMSVLCGPRGLPGETMSLYHNDGHGNFVDVSQKAGIAVPKRYYGFSVLTGDFDNDGWPDAYVACDSTASLFFHNKHDGTFEEIGVPSGTAYNDDGREQAGMGAAAADYDGDGLLDIFKTNFSDDTHTLYRNRGRDSFDDDTVEAGLAVNTRYLGWGTAFLDFDHDGWKDLFVANGHVYPDVGQAHTNETYKQPRLLYWNRGDGQFFDMSRESGSGIAAEHCSRGVATGDLDNDGALEIVVVNLGEPPSLLKNQEPAGNSLLVRALTAAGSDAIGARITLTAGGHKQMEDVRSGGSFMSQSDFRAHFGLGGASVAGIAVRWVDGKVDTFPNVAANQIVTVEETKGIIRRQSFARRQSVARPK
ncbi:MAG: CRTAC1 family protein [Bryobacteraceae bacterium]